MSRSSPAELFQAHLTEKFQEFLSWVQYELGVPDQIIQEALAHSLKPKPPAPKSKAKSKKSEDKPICIAMLKSKKDQQCDKKVSDKSETGNYCGLHLRLEQTEPGETKKGKKPSTEEEFNEEAEGYVFKLDYEGDLIFGKTGLVLKSAEEKVVIGRKIRKKGIVNLSEEDIALCKRRGFRFIPDYDKAQLPPVESDVE